MNSHKYTQLLIDKIVNNFSNLKCDYEFDELFKTHYVEIEPKFEFDKNEDLNNLLDEIYFEFIEEYPNESIAFSTNVGKNNLSNICYSVKGIKFENKASIFWDLFKIPKSQIISVNIIEENEFTGEDEFSCAA